MKTSFVKIQWAVVASFAIILAAFSACSNGDNSSSADNDDISEIESSDDSSASEDLSSSASSSSKKKSKSSSSISKGSSSSSKNKSSDSKERSSSSEHKSSSSLDDKVSSSSNSSPIDSEDLDLVTCKTEGLISYFLKNKRESVQRVCHDGMWVEVESSSSESPKSSGSGTPSTCTVKHYEMDSLFNPNINYDEFEDPRDGQKYKTVEMKQDGMSFVVLAQNLNYGTQINGLESVFDDNKIEKYCLEDDPWYCENGFGGLYSWSEAMGLPKACDTVKTGSTADCPDPLTEGTLSNADWAIVQMQGICPDGWHIMNEREWSAMAGGEYIGDLISSIFGNRDDYGFSALPAGILNTSGQIEYELAPKYGFIWLPQEYGTKTARSIAFTRALWDSNFNALYKKNGLSVRCVKNYKVN